MRAIKYRAKTPKGEWEYGYYLEFELCDGEGRCSYIKKDGRQSINVIKDTVGQFTGLTDKNGKEIYEGDIVKYIGNEIGDVFTNEIKYNGAGFDPMCAICWMSDIENTECEVIGNIHNNPELINEQ